MENDGMLIILKKMVKEMGTQKKVAEYLGISQVYLSDILSDRRSISDQVAQKLGYHRIVKYEKLEEG
jgi:plasmid maintenance system antidote protein VapI